MFSAVEGAVATLDLVLPMISTSVGLSPFPWEAQDALHLIPSEVFQGEVHRAPEDVSVDLNPMTVCESSHLLGLLEHHRDILGLVPGSIAAPLGVPPENVGWSEGDLYPIVGSPMPLLDYLHRVVEGLLVGELFLGPLAVL
jgi:hypothetical protein